MVSARSSIALMLVLGALLVMFSPLVLAQLVAFTGKDSNSPDEFAFVALQDIADGTRIFFTESDYDHSTGNFSGELLSNLVYGRPDAGGAVRGMIMRRASC